MERVGKKRRKQENEEDKQVNDDDEDCFPTNYLNFLASAEQEITYIKK